MRLSNDIRKTIVFLGFEDAKEAGGFRPVGTGFLLGYKSEGYLVTNRHVAWPLSKRDYCLRLNTVDGLSELVPCSSSQRWYYHEDDTVDLAVLPFEIRSDSSNYDFKYLTEDHLPTDHSMNEFNYDLGIGDDCYTVGMFRFLKGEGRNTPIVHKGTISMMAGEETIPAQGWNGLVQNVDAHLVEGQAISGASGSPVFARPYFDLENLPFEGKEVDVRLARTSTFLLGIWQGSWAYPPDEALENELTNSELADPKKIRVSVGRGLVVPSKKLLELMESSQLRHLRNETQMMQAATLD